MPISQVTETDSKVTVSKGYLSETKEFTFDGFDIYRVIEYGEKNNVPEIKCKKLKSYDPDTNVLVDSEELYTFTAYEQKPVVNWYYAGIGNTLFGNGILSDSPEAFYASFDHYKAVAESGQTLTYSDGTSHCCVDGVNCLCDIGPGVKVTPSDFLVEGNGGFTLSMFVRRDSGSAAVLFEAYSKDWSKHKGLEIWISSSNTVLIRGGDPDNTGHSETYIDNYNMPFGEWVHLALVFKNNYEEYYENGSLIGTRSVSRTFTNTLDYVLIGNRSGYSEPWNGNICEFKYYASILSAEEVKKEADRCLAMVTV